MNASEIRKIRTEYEEKIKELLVEMENKTDMYIHSIDSERFEAIPGGIGPIGNVKLYMGLDEY